MSVLHCIEATDRIGGQNSLRALVGHQSTGCPLVGYPRDCDGSVSLTPAEKHSPAAILSKSCGASRQERMGIPALFRWLSTKYPKVTSQCVEEKSSDEDGMFVPVDLTQPNPNGEEFDNLYLDMNGIIHPCCHPEDKPAPNTEEEMFIEIFSYIDRILGIIRPRKVLFMAIDGVAPRAKMNQQRSRRFRASQEAAELADEEEKLRLEWEAKNGSVQVEGGKKSAFDSNCITPGTPFMANLAVALRYYVSDRLNREPAWRDLKIILSDASVPGEGEHKIMDYIRRERIQKDYDPNTSHVLYGLDADLIMLALATHEPHFKILREDVFFNQKDGGNKCFICGQSGHQAAQCTGKKKEKNGEFDEKKDYVQKPYVFLHVATLREYLAAEMHVHNTPFQWDLERALDDWVFLCFFVGNDFLPHIPSLEIREGAIDTLIDIWKRNIHSFGGYITDCGEIDLARAQVMLIELGQQEDQVFVKRRLEEERRRAHRIRRNMEAKARAAGTKYDDDYGAGVRRGDGGPPQHGRSKQSNPMEVLKEWEASSGVGEQSYGIPEAQPVLSQEEKNAQNKAAAEALKRSLMGGSVVDAPAPPASLKRTAEDEGDMTEKKIAVEDEEEDEEVLEEGDTVEVLAAMPAPIAKTIMRRLPPKPDDDEVEPDDNIRLWENGWKKRYYERKFSIDVEDKVTIREIVTKYVEGFCWVLKYYYQGCQSWKWYFPYHYSPFASDFDFISTLTINLELGEPFKPIEQLMGVFPAASRQHIPDVFHGLMQKPDSPIIDFYPENFPVDLNGKKYAWQGVALLPFIDEGRLLSAMKPLYPQLSPAEVHRNTRGNEILFAREGNPLYEDMCDLYAKQPQSPIPINPRNSGRLLGGMLPDPDVTLPGTTFYNPLESQPHLPDIGDTRAISSVFVMPPVPASGKFPCVLLRGVKMPEAKLSPDDIMWVKMGGGASGGYMSGRGRGRGRGRGGPAQRFIQHGVGGNDNMPYMGGGGYGDGATASYSTAPDSYNRGQGGYGGNNYQQGSRGGYQGNNSNSNRGGYNGGYQNNGGGGDGSYNGAQRGGYQGSNYNPNYARGGRGGGGSYQNNGGSNHNNGGQRYTNTNSGGYNPSSSYGQQQSAYAPSYTPPTSQYGASLYGSGAPAQPQQQSHAPPYGSHALPSRPPANLAWSRNVASGAAPSDRGRGRGRGGSDHQRY
ncbi:5'-3' exoribonuclease 2 [Chytriomyces hyalinus]|nr:5'-3' exoribonuclease 2 [Chytriomyces hyalinus]